LIVKVALDLGAFFRQMKLGFKARDQLPGSGACDRHK
jgi:hypothetical protein